MHKYIIREAVSFSGFAVSLHRNDGIITPDRWYNLLRNTQPCSNSHKPP